MNSQKPDIEPLSPEEIKAIGEIELGPSKHEVFLNKHYKKLLWGGIGLGVAAGCTIAYFSHANDVKQAAAAEIVNAMKLTAPAGVVSPADFDAAALKTLETDYAITPSGDTATLLLGLKELTADHPEAGVKRLETLTSASSVKLIQARAYAALAFYAMGENKEDVAVANWEKLTALGETPYTALAYMTLGDVARTKGDKEKARDWYAQAESKCPTSPLVTGKTVQMHALMLDVDAPKHVPAPAAAESKDDSFSAPKNDNPFGDEPTNEPAPTNSGSAPLSSSL